MELAVLLLRTNVEHDRLAETDPLDELLLVDRIHLVPIFEERLRHRLDLEHSPLGEIAKSLTEVRNSFVSQAIGHEQPVLLRLDEARALQDTQVLRGVGDALVGGLGEGLDRPGSLAQQLEQLDADRVGDGFADPSEVSEDRVLERPFCPRLPTINQINLFIEYFFAGCQDVGVPSFDPGEYFFWLIAASLFCFLLERLFPWRREQPVLRRGLLQDFFWLFFNGHFAGVLLAVPAAWAITRIGDLFGLAKLPVPESVALLETAPLAVQFLVVLVVKDFLEWFIHRMLHRVPWLWEFHKVHHSIEALDWIGSFRFHWMETVVYRGLTYLPLVLLGIDARVVLANAVVGTLIGHLNHANIRFDWGPLRYVLNSPRFHVWHHDRELHGRHGQNFAIVLSVWDWIFGTAYFPREVEQPHSLGFEGDEALPRSTVVRLFHPVSTWLLRPMMRRHGATPALVVGATTSGRTARDAQHDR